MKVKYQARQTESPPGIEVKGDVLLSLYGNLEQFLTDVVFDRHGLTPKTVDPDDWYSGDVVFEVYQEVRRQPGGPMALVAMGKAAAPLYVQLMSMETPQDFIDALPIVSTLSVRNYPEGFGYIATLVGENHYHILNHTSTPNDLVYGAVWESMRLLTASDEQFRVIPLSGYPHSEECAVFDVRWGKL